MRPFRFLPKAIRVLLIANAVIFAVAFFLGSMMGLHLNLPGAGYGNVRDYIVYFGAFFPTSPLEAWRYVTYMFVHVDFWHFVFNMLMLWMFGSSVCEYMGAKHFTAMYLFCGVFAAFFSFILCSLGLTNNPIIGASGALMGIFVACYKFFPEGRILMFFFIPMKLKHAMWVMVLFDLLMAHSNDGVAHFAHLGGVAAGFIYMALYGGGFRKLQGGFRKTRMHVEDGGWRSSSQNRREADESRGGDEPEVLEGEVFYVDEQKRMDEILRKVNSDGLNSLTETERQFLLKAGERLRRRRGGM